MPLNFFFIEIFRKGIFFNFFLIEITEFQWGKNLKKKKFPKIFLKNSEKNNTKIIYLKKVPPE